ncbi:unnamed protein product [Darwinula stevensoni]|uniref:Dihydrolipoamide acetyltransferase component of pyruvate dehydrogenase complex n=1 Tax=Darwinula stevensoni TaxID=69355 RepID=A0A7R8XCH7_9CRUS|nr:unnamed protein product [Darwinula stevensoni]CAG0885817.1 unnamed protein product [Darwinula stevensoni]
MTLGSSSRFLTRFNVRSFHRWRAAYSMPLTSQRKKVSEFSLGLGLSFQRPDFCQDFYHGVGKTRGFQCSPIQLATIVPFNLSDIGEGIREVVVKEWFVKEGDKVAQFDSICEVQSDKASVTITSRYDGIVKKLHYNVDDTAIVGKPLVDIEIEESRQEHEPQVTVQEGVKVGTTSDLVKLPEEKVLATPSVRRLAAEHNVKLSSLRGTGKDGRVSKEDILRYLEEREKGEKKPPKQEIRPPPPPPDKERKAPPPPITHSPVTRPQLEDKHIPIKGIVKAMVKTMTVASRVPLFGYADEVDMTECVHLRHLMNKHSAERGIKFSFMPLILKAVSLALLEYPRLNATVDENCEMMTYRGNHNIGVAVDTPDGLLVPNVKNVESLSVMEIAQEMRRLQDLALKNSLTTQDLSGGTFSLSNIGSVSLFLLIIYLRKYLPISSITGQIISFSDWGNLCKANNLTTRSGNWGLRKNPEKFSFENVIFMLLFWMNYCMFQVLPRFSVDGNIEKVHIMNVSWSADHRVIDGATMARFSNLFKSYLENPGLMLLQLK